MQLRVGSGPWTPITLTSRSQAGPLYQYRGYFHRLVSDSVDDAELPLQQTILCKLRDLILVRYNETPTCASQAAIRVGRPVSEDNNDHPDHLQHDVRELKLNIVVFSTIDDTRLAQDISAFDTTIPVLSVGSAQPQGAIRIGSEIISYTGVDQGTNSFTGCTRGAEGSVPFLHSEDDWVLYPITTPSATLATVQSHVDTLDERMAQAGIRSKVTAIDIGGQGEPGITLPASLFYGFTPSLGVVTDPTPSETAVILQKDGDVNSIDVFYVPHITDNSSLAQAYPRARNQTSPHNHWFQNFIVMGPGAVLLTLSHEIMHILLNAPHRTDQQGTFLDPTTALFHPVAVSGIPVRGPKRIGPYPDAKAKGVGEDDTYVIRSNAEQLPS